MFLNLSTPVSSSKRRLLLIGVAIIVIVFTFLYFYLLKNNTYIQVKNRSIYIQNSTVTVFDDTYSIEKYPDKVLFHFPYVIVNTGLMHSIAYNINSSEKTILNEIVLDYDGTNILHNKGDETLLNGKSLQVLCDIGFIINNSDVLCVTKLNSNYASNHVIKISANSLKQEEVYKSDNLITAVSIINDNLYIGSINQFNNKSTLTVNDVDYDFPDVINFIYQIDGKPFVASLKSPFNNQAESAYSIDNPSNIVKFPDSEIPLNNIGLTGRQD